jgi:hypothetical protein
VTDVSTKTHLILLVGRLLLVSAVAVPVTWASAAGASTPRNFYEVPVHLCPSWYGASTTQDTHPRGPILADLPDAIAGQLSFVTDTSQDISPILTFTNWACSFGVGADGSWGLTSTNNAAPSEQVDVTDPLLTAGDAWGLLCHLYPAIDSLYPSKKCPAIAAGRERVTSRVGNATYFTDAPRTVGTAPGSGSPLTTLGVSIYYGKNQRAVTSSWGYGIAMGCTLPTSQASTCTTPLRNFASHH